MKKLQLVEDRTRIMTAVSLGLLLFLSVITLITGSFANNQTSKITPTPIGAQGAFKKSGATATIKGYYQDKDKTALAVAIKIEENTSSPLPYKAQDYFVSWSGDGKLSGYFGRYGTDGDLYVVIPNPKEDVMYSISITNLNYQGDTSTKIKDQSLKDLKGSVSKQLSASNELGASGSNTTTVENEQTDTITFKMTINDKSNTKNYKIKTIDTPTGSLLKTSKGNSLTFDFKTFWDLVYRKPEIKKASTNLQNSIQRESEAQSNYNEQKERFDKNPNDLGAQELMSRYSDMIKTEQAKQDNYSEKLKEVQSVHFNKEDFSDYTTTIYDVKK